jgi:hypothetical protein
MRGYVENGIVLPGDPAKLARAVRRMASNEMGLIRFMRSWSRDTRAFRRSKDGFSEAWLWRPQGGGWKEPANFRSQAHALAARRRPGYSLPGCFPAAPDSASPGNLIVSRWQLTNNACGRQSHASKIQWLNVKSVATYAKAG